MNDYITIENLEKIGLTPYEAKIYYALSENNKEGIGINSKEAVSIVKKLGKNKGKENAADAMTVLVKRGYLLYYKSIDNFEPFHIRVYSDLLTLKNKERRGKGEKRIQELIKEIPKREAPKNMELGSIIQELFLNYTELNRQFRIGHENSEYNLEKLISERNNVLISELNTYKK
jgi:hypothetical protein